MTLRPSPGARRARQPPSWGSVPSQRSRPAGVRSTRAIQGPASSALGVSHALDGLLLPQAPGPFQAGAAHRVLPAELSSSRGAARLSASFLSCRFQQPRSSTLRLFWTNTVLRGFRVLLPPWSPRPAGLPPGRRAVALMGFTPSRVLAAPPRPTLPPAFPHALRTCRATRRAGHYLRLGASMDGAVRASVAGRPTLLGFSTWSRPRHPLGVPRRFRRDGVPPARGGLPPTGAGVLRLRATLAEIGRAHV